MFNYSKPSNSSPFHPDQKINPCNGSESSARLPFITVMPCPLLLFLLPVLLATSLSLKHAKYSPTLGHLPWLTLLSLMLFSRYPHC